MPKQKYYVVWKGRKTGIFTSWDECKNSVDRYVGALYKSYLSRSEAETAFVSGYTTQSRSPSDPSQIRSRWVQSHRDNPAIETPSISVDGAWNTVSWVCEYQWVDTATGERLFAGGPYADGTNNIVEFLAIVHGLQYCLEHWLTTYPIYSDSHTAIVWVGARRANTRLISTGHNTELFGLIRRAEEWLTTHTYVNPIIKWETREWWEIPADFGRK